MLFESRVRKKKGLTDPVVILPFPGQNNLREKVTKEVSPTQPKYTNYAETVQKKEPKILASASDTVHSANLSIKKSIFV